MIISFSLENWMSFRNPVTFSMVASRERQHGDRVPRLGKYQTRVLPIAAIYGGNASGKTNFFEALRFAKTLVVKGVHLDSLIPVEPFRLDARSAGQPSRFCFEILVEERIYEFRFAVTRNAVLEEKLMIVTGSREKTLYHRQQDKINFDNSLAKDQFLQFAFEGTRDNQLFLTNSVSQKVNQFRPIYDWFDDTLTLVTSDAYPIQPDLFVEEHPLYSTMNEALSQLDTGIKRLGSEEVPMESVPMTESLKAGLQENLKEGMTAHLSPDPSGTQFMITRKNGELSARKRVAYHSKEGDAEARFDIHKESVGSLRVIELLPLFVDLSVQGSKKVYIIDEMDRSLHTLLTRKLLEAYLSNCSTETRSQLLLTTHDALLMDQQLLRRDEMWVAERDAAGASSMVSFSEYKDVRYDKDIRKSYLQGRLGGIPRIPLEGALDDFCVAEESAGDG